MKRLLLGAMMVALLSACGAVPGTSLNPSPTPSSPTATASPGSSPSTSPLASPTAPAGFVETPVSGGAVATSTVTDVRIGQHPGYDRIVIEFAGGIPSYTVTPQSSATFTRSPRGDQVTLEGSSGVLIVVHSITNWTAYGGPTAFRPDYPYMREALQVENYEGYQQWALGIHGSACVRVSTMSSPSRLVIDVVGI